MLLDDESCARWMPGAPIFYVYYMYIYIYMHIISSLALCEFMYRGDHLIVIVFHFLIPSQKTEICVIINGNRVNIKKIYFVIYLLYINARSSMLFD